MLQFLGVSLSDCQRGHRHHKLFKLDAQGELTEKTQRSTTTNTHPKKYSPIISDNELKSVCLNARSIVKGGMCYNG